MGAMAVLTRRFFVLVPTYRVIQGIPVIHLYGISDRGESVLAVDDRVRPYIFVPAADLAAAAEIARPIEARPEPDLLDLEGRPAARLVLSDPRGIPRIREDLLAAGIPSLEADVRFAYRYMIDRGIRGSAEISGEAREGRHTDLVFRRPEFRPARFGPELRVVSLDIETDRKAKTVYSAALLGDGVDTVLIRGEREVEGAEVVPDERTLFARIEERIREADPDVITGWNVVDFDLRVLESRSGELGVPLRIGRGEESIFIQEDPGFTRQRRASIPGRQVLDGIGLVRDAGLRFEDFRLQTVSAELLGRGKLAEGPNRVERIERALFEEPEWLARYNMEDARLVLEILSATKALDLAVERSLLTGMPLDRVGASVASFDFLYLGELRKKGRVAPTVQETPPPGHIVGGTVLDSRPGIFPYVAVLDFKSLYPSIIRTFGIDPLAFAGAGEAGEGFLRAPNGALFRREGGILPEIIAELMARRDLAKKEGDGALSTAVKLLMNSFYGVMGTASCRFAGTALANAITSFGGEILLKAKSEIEKMGYEVVYGDTDSVFVLTRAGDGAAARKVGSEIRERVNRVFSDWVREEYGVESHLEIELEKIYRRFLMPQVRGGAEGSKKRYAGLAETEDGTELEIVGLEAVRRDWPEAGRRFQKELLGRVFAGGEIDDWVRTFVRELRGGLVDDELVYRKVLRKDPDEYVRADPPHVRAARLAGKRRGSTVRYVITRGGPAPVSRIGPMPGGIDYDHYVRKVIEPIADAILPFLGKRFDEVSGDDPQLKLFD